jgi:imidazolonepropionase-like amidohydrolase
MGVIIIAGSDAGSCGVPHGLGLLHELELMERAGMPSLAVINAATGAGANRLGYREKFGRIEPGWRARFIVTAHSPLDTVANLRKPFTMVFDGAPQTSGVDPAGL